MGVEKLLRRLDGEVRLSVCISVPEPTRAAARAALQLFTNALTSVASPTTPRTPNPTETDVTMVSALAAVSSREWLNETFVRTGTAEVNHVRDPGTLGKFQLHFDRDFHTTQVCGLFGEPALLVI